MSMKAIVKSVISGDSLVLRSSPGPQGQPAKERILHLAEISTPRMGSSNREDEPWAFESREFLRALAVGKEISFVSTHSLPPNSDTPSVPRDFGTAEIGGLDLATELLKAGWAKVKESKRDATEEDNKRRELETEARVAGKGLHNPHGPTAREVHHTMPADSQAFVTEWKGKPLDGLVEQVRDGTTLRVRLFMPDGEQQHINIALAGVRSARAASKQGEPSEQWGEEAKFFVESRLLQRHVSVTILSLPASTATPFSQSGASAPPPASIFIGTVLHTAGNVAEHLVGGGLARVVDWHAGMLAANGQMERLRAAEKAAKEKRLCLYANALSAAASAKAAAAAPARGAFEATVVRVWSGDQISIVEHDTGAERRIQLSSLRAPKQSDPKQTFYANEAREFLRKKLIGKNVKVNIDFIRPREGDFEERECATVRFGGQQANVAEQLVEKGLASIVRHRRDDEDRSPDYDKLMAAEQVAITGTKGIHSGKDQPAPKQPMNISETQIRANQFLNGFKRQGKVSGIVDYVASGSRFKILLPKDNQSLTLVLAGIRAPRTARNASDKGEPFGNEAAEFASRRYLQREVQFEVETVDKSGGFIGTLYLDKTDNAAVSLTKEGLASVHLFSAEGLSWARQLTDAENEAKRAKHGIWKDYDAAAAKAAEEAPAEDSTAPLKAEYLDVIISDVRTQNGLAFSVQILNTEGIASLEKLMHDFTLHYRAAPATTFAPRAGELVSAKFSDGSWYRAKIRRVSAIKKEAEVTFIDYGNQDTVSFANLRPLDPKFRSLPGQAHDARLSFVKLVGNESEYFPEAIDRFRSLCEGRKLIANVDHREGSVLHLRLIDPTSDAAQDPLSSINAELLSDGVAAIDRKGCRYLSSYPAVVKKLQEAVLEAKRSRAGMFEFGDVEEDE